MSLPQSEIARRFSVYEIIGHTILDAKNNPIKLGDIVFNSKTGKEVTIDENMIKTLDFSVEVLGMKNMSKLTLVNDKKELSREVVLDNTEDEDEEDEFEEDCECTIEPKKIIDFSKSKDLNNLKKLFDIVEIQTLNEYQLLTIKDISNNPSMDWIVWLEVKILINSNKKRFHNQKSNEEYMKGALENISVYAPLLTKYKESNIPKQVLLFEDEISDKLEKEPTEPEENESWGKYFTRREEIRKRNIFKKYEFFDVCNLYSSWFAYGWWNNSENPFLKQLPKDDNEIIEIIKKNIIELTKDNRIAHGRYNHFWWDNSYKYIKIGDTLSDIELVERVSQMARVYFSPYKHYAQSVPDLSYMMHGEHQDTIRYRFYFDGDSITGGWSEKVGRTYNLHKREFVKWLREWFSIGYKDNLTDKDAIGQTLEQYYKMVAEDFDFKKAIQSVMSVEDYIKLFNSEKIKKTFTKDSGSSICLPDGYGGSINTANGSKDSFHIYQRNRVRILQNKKIDENNWCTEFVRINGIKEIHKKAFELFCDKEAIEAEANRGQGSLF